MTQNTCFKQKSSGWEKIGDVVIFFLSPEGFKTLGHWSFGSFLKTSVNLSCKLIHDAGRLLGRILKLKQERIRRKVLK
jgi:hypothetical protein